MQRFPFPRIRARRPRPAAASSGASPAAAMDPAGAPPVDAEYAFRRAELADLGLAVGSHLGEPDRRIASPEELRSALAAVLGDAIGEGWVDVRRMPPALHSTEYWHVTLMSVTAEARATMDRLVEEARCVR